LSSGPTKIERDDARVGADQRGRDGGLNEHLVGGIVAVDLENVTEGDAAAQLRVARIARERGRYLADRGRHAVACCRDAIAEPARFQRRQLGGIVGGFTHRLDEPLAIVRTPRRHHELDVLHVLAVVEIELVDVMSTNCEPDTVPNFSKAAKNSSWPVGTAGVGRNQRIENASTMRL
jgi:hypothetical protein